MHTHFLLVVIKGCSWSLSGSSVCSSSPGSFGWILLPWLRSTCHKQSHWGEMGTAVGPLVWWAWPSSPLHTPLAPPSPWKQLRAAGEQLWVAAHGDVCKLFVQEFRAENLGDVQRAWINGKWQTALNMTICSVCVCVGLAAALEVLQIMLDVGFKNTHKKRDFKQ